MTNGGVEHRLENMFGIKNDDDGSTEKDHHSAHSAKDHHREGSKSLYLFFGRLALYTVVPLNSRYRLLQRDYALVQGKDPDNFI